MSCSEHPLTPVVLFCVVYVMFACVGIGTVVSNTDRVRGVETFRGSMTHFSNCTSDCGSVVTGSGAAICFTSFIGDVTWSDANGNYSQEDVGGLFAASFHNYKSACDNIVVPANVMIVTSYGVATGIRSNDFDFPYLTFSEGLGYVILIGVIVVTLAFPSVYIYERCKERRRHDYVSQA